MPPRRCQSTLTVRLLAALAAAGPLVGCDALAPKPAPLAPEAQGPLKVFSLGSLEPAGGILSISAAPGDRLKALDPDVAVNRRTPADGILGLMASYDTRLAQLEALETKRELVTQKHKLDLAAAEAQVMSAAASLAQAKAKRTEVEMQAKRLAYLKEASSIATADYQRLERLSQSDDQLVTDHELRRQRNRADQAQKDFEIADQSYGSAVAAAEAAYAAAVASQKAAKQSHEHLKAMNPAVAVDKEIELGRFALAQSVLLTPDVNRTELDAANVKLQPAGEGDPGAYTVLRVFLRPGEAVTQTPVLQIGDLSRIVCVAEVYEADAKKIRPGQPATITSNAFSEEFSAGIPGEVERVSRVVASPGLSARNPLAPVDRSVVAVRVTIDPENAAAIEEAGRWIGLQVQVSFEE